MQPVRDYNQHLSITIPGHLSPKKGNHFKSLPEPPATFPKKGKRREQREGKALEDCDHLAEWSNPHSLSLIRWKE
jgi:hypothetical protein